MGWGWPQDAKPYDSDGSTQRANDYITQMRKEHEQRVDSLVSIIEAVQEVHSPYPQNTTGVDAYANWYCKGCRHPWPCATWEATRPRDEFPSQLTLDWKRKS